MKRAARETGSVLELLAATGLAVAQPVVAAFRDSPDTFVARGASARDVVLWTVVLVLGPPAALWLVEIVVGLVHEPARDGVHAVFVGVGVGIAAGRGGPVPEVVTILVVAVAVTVLMTRFEPIRTWLRVLGAFPLLLAAELLLISPVSDLVVGDGDASAGGGAARDPAPVVFVILDELPLTSIMDGEGHIDRTQFPNLAALADDSTWYRNFSSVSPTTPQAVPPILTGELPDDPTALPIDAEHPDNLFTLLPGTYEQNVVESGTSLCPTDVCEGNRPSGNALTTLLGDAWDLWRRQVSPTGDDDELQFTPRQSDPSAPEHFAEFVDSLDGPGGLRLDFIHLLYPHQPWRHLPSGQRYDAPFIAEGLSGATYAWTDQAAADAGRQRHLLQARHADRLLGDLLDRMHELGTYDDSLLVVLADHGVAFTPGSPIRGVSEDNHAEVTRAPLLIKAPGQDDGVVDDRPVWAVDVLPTIADHLGIDVPWAMDGRSALGDPRPEGDRPFYQWRFNALEPDEDGFVMVPGGPGLEQVLAAEPPGEGQDAELRFYRFGRHADLVGRRVSDLRVGEASGSEGDLDAPDSFDDADPDGPVVPAYVSGSVDRGTGDVAVAVNGVVGGWSTPRGGSGRPGFYTLVPPQLLVAGENDIDAYEIDETPAGVVLRPITLDG